MKTTRIPIEELSIRPASLIGRDEMNLAELPIALVADRRPEDQKTLYFEDKHGRLTITGSDAFGLPTATDTDVIIALMYLTKLRNNFGDTKVNFSRYELIRLLNWKDDGRSYKRLDESFNRWTGVLLVYDKCWWNNRLKCYTSAKIHIIDDVEILDNDARQKAHKSGQNVLPLSSFTWDRKFIESCQADNLRQLNLDIYFSLKSAVSKRLYRFLGKRFYVKDDYTFDLNEIAFDRVGLSRSYTDAYKIKEKLQPAIEELEAIGFLRPLSPDKRYRRIDRGQWTIRLVQQPAALTITPTLPPASHPTPSPHLAALISRGVTVTVAAKLVKEHGEEAVCQQMDILDGLSKKKREKIDDEAAYLVRAITEGWQAPKGFIPKAERERIAEAKRKNEEDAAATRRQQRERDAAERRLNNQVQTYRKSRTPEQLAQLEAEAIVQASEATRLSLDEPHMRDFRQTSVTMLINEHIARLIQAGQLVVEPA